AGRRQFLLLDRPAGRAAGRRGRRRGDVGVGPDVLGARHLDGLAGAQRIGRLQPVAVDDRLHRDAVARGDALDSVLVLDDVDRDGVGTGGGARILHGAFTGAIEGRTAAESGQRRDYDRRAPPAGPSRGVAKGSFHAPILLHHDSGGNPADALSWAWT